MEPISAAMAAFSVVSAGVKAGKDLASLGKPLGKLFDGIDEAKQKHSKKETVLLLYLQMNKPLTPSWQKNRQKI